MTQSNRNEQTLSRSCRNCLILLGLLLSACVSACSTTEGFGNDVKHLGGDIEGSAARNK